MRGQDLLDVLEHIRPELIEEAGKASPRKSVKWIGVAAAILLVLGIGTIGTHYLGLGNHIPSGAEPASNVQQESTQQPEDSTLRETSPAVKEKLLSMTLGGLSLGMSEEEVKSIIGEPDGYSNSGPIKDETGNTRISWFYKFSDNPDTRYDVNLRMIDTGSGWILNEITAYSSSDFSLSNGIHIGSTLEDVDAICGSDYDVIDEDTKRVYMLGDNLLYLHIVLSDDVVTNIYLGAFVPENIDLGSTEPADPPYSLSGDPITVYQRTETGWTAKECSGKEAKRIEVIMEIEELQAYDGEKQVISYVVDFHNGTIAVLYSSDESGAVYTTKDFDPEILDTENWESKLSLYMVCFFPPGTWDAVAGN